MRVRRKSLWRKKNARMAYRKRVRSAASVAWEAQTRQQGRAEKAARSAESLAAEAGEPSMEPVSRARPDHTLEVRLRIDDCERTFRAVCIGGEWHGHSGNVITQAIRLVMAAAVRQEG